MPFRVHLRPWIIILLCSLVLPAYSISANAVPAAAPDPPTNVQASDGVYQMKIKVTWTASAGAAYYRIFRTNTVGYISLEQVSITTELNDVTVVFPDVIYTYKVRACNSANECGGWSSTDTGWCLPLQPTATPTFPPPTPTRTRTRTPTPTRTRTPRPTATRTPTPRGWVRLPLVIRPGSQG